jgi:CO/xanthine dehydrogenase Mo-binding subunit
MTTNVVGPTVVQGGLLATDELRVDGREKVSGRAQFTADLARPEMLWAWFVESAHAHAVIRKIDTAAARAMRGVHGVLTGADIGPRYFGMMLADRPVLALERVRFIGEYVAVVAAETREIAEAAAAAIEVTYEALPGTFDTEAAIVDGAPLVHADESPYAYRAGPRPPRPHPNVQGHQIVEKGDPNAAFAACAHVFERTFRTPRFHAGYLEPRATLVWLDAGVLHVASTNQVPFNLRDMLAMTTGLPKEQIVVESNFVGGSFGAKSLTVEEFPLYYLARATNRPVKYVRTHAQDVRSAGIRHASTVRARIGTTREGKIEAIDLRVLFDGGAYAAAKALPGLVPGKISKIPYGFKHARVERMTVYTNTIPATFVRAPSDVQVMFAFESLMDIVAAELGIDPLELRLRNAAAPGDSDVEGDLYMRPRARQVLETLRDSMGWSRPPAPGYGRGIGFTARHIAFGMTSLLVTAHANGTFTVDTGLCEPGVGQQTVIARILATELGVDPSRITVTRRNTGDVPLDVGIGASRGTLLLGHALIDAAQKLRAEMAGRPGDEVRVVGEGKHLPVPGEPMWVSFGAYGVELAVDRGTGAVTIHRVGFVGDVGAIINPVAHRGQIDGAFAMGLGMALTEELVIEDGRIVNVALSEYKLPCQRDMPPFAVTYLEPDGGPGVYGSRAVGEFGIAGVAPAIANAIAAACGVRLDTLAMTSERIYAALSGRANATV